MEVSSEIKNLSSSKVDNLSTSLIGEARVETGEIIVKSSVADLFCVTCHRGPFAHTNSLKRHMSKYHKIDTDSVRMSTRSSAHSSLNNPACESDTESLGSVSSNLSVNKTSVNLSSSSTCSVCRSTFKNLKGLRIHEKKSKHYQNWSTSGSGNISDCGSDNGSIFSVTSESSVIKTNITSSSEVDNLSTSLMGGAAVETGDAIVKSSVAHLFCDSCRRGPFANANSLKTHVYKYHKIDTDLVSISTRSSANTSLNNSVGESDTESLCSVNSEPSVNETSVNISSSSTCSVCTRTFKNIRGLKMHARQTSHYQNMPISSSVNVSLCESDNDSVCSANSESSVDSIGINRASSSGGLVCSMCGKVFKNSRALKMHVMKAHKEDRRNASTSFVVEDLENIPISSCEETSAIVTKEPNCRCSTCYRTFKTDSALKLHQAQKHAKSTSLISSSELNDPSIKLSHSLIDQSSQVHVFQSSVPTPVVDEVVFRTPLPPSAAEDNRIRTRSGQSQSGNATKFDLKIGIDSHVKAMKKAALKEQSNVVPDPYLDKLTSYHERLLSRVSNMLTEKLPDEVREVIHDTSLIDNYNRGEFRWSEEDRARLNKLNSDVENLQVPKNWTWAAREGTETHKFNHNRMQYCVRDECGFVLRHCEKCGCTGLLVGLDQMQFKMCYDCHKIYEKGGKMSKESMNKMEEWEKVKPKSDLYPTLIGNSNVNLPELFPGDKAVLAPVFPVVTLKKNYKSNMKLKQECITLTQDAAHTWSKILPRTDLKNRFVIIERRAKAGNVKHIVADTTKVRQWLLFLFQNHPDFISLSQDNELQMSEEALRGLQLGPELAEVFFDPDETEIEQDNESSRNQESNSNDDNLTIHQAELHSGLSEHSVFTFDRYPKLYLDRAEFLKVEQSGRIEIVKDKTEHVPIYTASAKVAFPHLYFNSEKAPLDCCNYQIGKFLLKKQCLFAFKLVDERKVWSFAEDDIHLMWSYSRLVEMRVRYKVSYYCSQHEDTAHMPIDLVLKAFKSGFSDDNAIESQLPGLSTILSQIPHSREKWFNARLDIDAISRDLGSANVFLTMNNDPRADPGVRRLIHLLETGEEIDQPPFETDTNKFTKMLNKYATMINIYLSRKAKIFYNAFLSEVCGVEQIKHATDWTNSEKMLSSWAWQRVEFTETRGVMHFHALVKLPNVLDTALLGRIVHSGRLIRTEIKFNNIKEGKEEEAWEMLEAGLLAHRYVMLFGDSISTNSFYTEEMPVDEHDSEKVIDLNKLRQQYVEDFKNKNINLESHPVMRTFADKETDPNPYMEAAKTAAVSCIHGCIRNICGGDPTSGAGCRFNFPQKTLRKTVAGVFQVNSTQMECRLLLRRTPGAERVPNLNIYFLLYWKANHDLSVLIDGAHKMRYVTKYASKSGRYAELLNEVIEFVSKRSVDVLPLNLKTVLTHLMLCSVAHRSFMSKQEIAYYVLELPTIRQSFPSVSVIGFYRRSNITIPQANGQPIVFSDRTEYSAYSERLDEKTTVTGSLTKEMLNDMCYREFAETVMHEWKLYKKNVPTSSSDCTNQNEPSSNNPSCNESTSSFNEASSNEPSSARKVFTRDISSGHWQMHFRRNRRHIRFSTVLYTDRPENYEPITLGVSTPQTSYFELPVDKRRQLYRAYYELICYVKWHGNVDDYFIKDPEVRAMLNNTNIDPERDQRYSLMRLEVFWQIYLNMYNSGKVAPPKSQWSEDNMFSYSMYLSNGHNSDIHCDRVDNRGVGKARFEAAEELDNIELSINPEVAGDNDLDEYPTALNFLPPDTFREVMEQKPPTISEISVAFPMHINCQKLEKLITINSNKLFMATPPEPSVLYDQLTPVQQWAVDLGVDPEQRVLYLCGPAGSGKTITALHIAQKLKNRIQCGASTGKASSNLNAPTVHGMFGWGFSGFGDSDGSKMGTRKIAQLRTFYSNIECFLIDEVNAMSAETLLRLHNTMTLLFNPQMNKNEAGHVYPFGNKKMIFVGDPMQLPPINSLPIYKVISQSTSNKARGSSGNRQNKLHNDTSGTQIYKLYMESNIILMNQAQRNCGLLQEICTRLREGRQTSEDLQLLTFQRRRFPQAVTDFGIHFDNDSCSMFNWRQLWDQCKAATPQKRLYICKASYMTNEYNQNVVNWLSAMPPAKFNYAEDVLCVTEGCDVRLITNLNVAAGLVNSACGTVVKVLFDNIDIPDLLAGKTPPPYCIIVDIPSFQGFPSKIDQNQRIYPFPNKKTLVPIYRQKFVPLRKDLSSTIVLKQTPSECFRLQFGLSLSRNLTAHRIQGTTLRDSLVSVNMNLDTPDARMPPDVSSVFYVAVTRVVKLDHLFVSPILPAFWEKMGRLDVDFERRTVVENLRTGALNFAKSKLNSHESKYKLDQVIADLEWVSELSEADRKTELDLLNNQDTAPAAQKPLLHIEIEQHQLRAHRDGGGEFDLCLDPVMSERYIGLDQGRCNFGFVVVDKRVGESPVVVFAENYDLNLSEKAEAPEILVELKRMTPLLDMMLKTNNSPSSTRVTEPKSNEPVNPATVSPLSCDIDRVVVLVEQISAKNAQWKEFGINLGTLLQQQVPDLNSCIVKLSQPHLHRATGPMFLIGQKIVRELKLVAATYGRKSTKIEEPSQPSTSSVCEAFEPQDDDMITASEMKLNTLTTEMCKLSVSAPVKRRRICHSDVEPSDDSESEETPSTSVTKLTPPSKKSTKIIRSTAKTSKQTKRRRAVDGDDVTNSASPSKRSKTVIELNIPCTAETNDAEYKHKKEMSAKIFKYFMYADEEDQADLGVKISVELQEKWRQKILENVTIKLDDTGDALLHCLSSILCTSNYRQLVPSCLSLHANRTIIIAVLPEITCWAVLHCSWNLFELENFGCYRSQLEECYFNSPDTVTLISQQLSDNLDLAIRSFDGENVYRRTDYIKIVIKQLTGYKSFTNRQAGCLTQSTVEACKQLCTSFIGDNTKLINRHDKVTGWTYIHTNKDTGNKYHIIRSAGKHLNSMVSFLSWMLENAKRFIDKRLFALNIPEKLKFFNALQQLAKSADDETLGMLTMSQMAKVTMNSFNISSLEDNSTSLIADLILIGVDKNQQHVRAVASNYRRNRIIPSSDDAESEFSNHARESAEQRSSTPPVIVEPSGINISASNNSSTFVNKKVVKRQVFQDQESVAVEIVPSNSNINNPTSNNPSSAVVATCEFLNSAMAPGQIHLDLDIEIEDLLANRNLKIITARGDGHCLIHAWAKSTNISEEIVKELLIREFDTNILRYTAAGITRSDFMEYVEDGRYAFDAADAVVDMLCNATGRTALIIGRKYRYYAARQSTVVNGVTQINRIGNLQNITSYVLLLKSDQHYDSLN